MEMRRRLPADVNSAIAAAQATASDVAERYLKSLIFSGQLVPGDRLPSERELATQLGISRITLRAALRALEAVGYLVITIGSKGGARINDAATIHAHWEQWMHTHEDQLEEMLEFRRWVETQIVSLAAERRTPEDLKTLEKARGLPVEEDRLSVVQWHFGFHDALAKAAHNRYLEQAMVTIRGELFVPVDWVISEHREAEIENVHDRILDAVRAGDPAEAVQQMALHLEFSEKPFRPSLENHTASDRRQTA